MLGIGFDKWFVFGLGVGLILAIFLIFVNQPALRLMFRASRMITVSLMGLFGRPISKMPTYSSNTRPSVMVTVDRRPMIYGFGTGLVYGPIFGLVVGYIEGREAGLGFGSGFGLGVGFGTGFTLLVRYGSRVGFRDFPNLWPYLRLMGRPLLGYTLGYAAIVVWFSSVYASLYALNLHACRVQHQVIPCDAAFSGISTPHFGDFLFFAITIFPPIGAYSDLKPLAPWAQGVVAGELIVGVGYTTVVFAAILAYRTPAFDKLRRWNTQKAIARHMEFMKADLKAELHNAQKQTHTDLNNLDERMKRIEDQLKELTKQHSSASAQGATRRTRRHTWRRK